MTRLPIRKLNLIGYADRPLQRGLGSHPMDQGGGAPVTLKSLFLYTDVDSDIDDGMAMAIQFQMAKQSEINILGVGVDSNNTSAAPAAKVLCAKSGYPNTPVVAYQGTSIGGGSASLFTLPLVTRFGNPTTDTRSNYPDTVAGSRAAFAAAADQSVRVAIIGTATGFAALLASPADGISPLTGVQLVAAKCDPAFPVIMMGGSFVDGTIVENNIGYDVAAANVIANTCPVNVYWSGQEVGGTVLTRLNTDVNRVVDYPYSLAWTLCASLLTGGTRPSWDLTAVLAAVRGKAGVFDYSAPGNTNER